MFRQTIAFVTCFTATSVSAQLFDETTTNALSTCDSHLQYDVAEFKDLPRAAITVFPGLWNETTVTVLWNVMWDDPYVRSAGNCLVVDGELQEFEDYTK